MEAALLKIEVQLEETVAAGVAASAEEEVLNIALAYALVGAAPSDPGCPVAKALAGFTYELSPDFPPSLQTDVAVRAGRWALSPLEVAAAVKTAADDERSTSAAAAVVAQYIASRALPPPSSRYRHYFCTELNLRTFPGIKDSRLACAWTGVVAAEGWPDATHRLSGEDGEVHFYAEEAAAREAAASQAGQWSLQGWSGARGQWVELGAGPSPSSRGKEARRWFTLPGATSRYIFASAEAADLHASVHEVALALCAEKPA